MTENEFRQALSDLHLGGLLFFQKLESTNSLAKDWAMKGAPDLAVVYAEEQTSGRGRGSRTWITTPSTALTFSIVFGTRTSEWNQIQKFTALGALAVCEAVNSLGFTAKIKWPNDVLIDGRKFCGILAETIWMNANPMHVIMGIGVNVLTGAVPISEHLNFPATSLEMESGMAIDRGSLLKLILEKILLWRRLLESDEFMAAWEKSLAFMGDEVVVKSDIDGNRIGRIVGLEGDGSLVLISGDGEKFSLQVGEIQLRPLV